MKAGFVTVLGSCDFASLTNKSMTYDFEVHTTPSKTMYSILFLRVADAVPLTGSECFTTSRI